MALILVVDDEQVMRTFLDKALQRLGHEVALAGDVEEALELFSRKRFSLVLSDLRMPGRSGMDLLDQLIALDPTTPVILMTAFGSINTAVEAVQHGAADFLTKPLEIAHIKLVIERTLEKRRASEELDRLRPHADQRGALGGLVGASLAMKQVYSTIDKVASKDLTVLILGETGTGKDLCARAMHEQSQRAAQRFQVVNCSALSDTLLESELFGHEKGAFTGADKRKLGHFEVATGGTLFLDEVGDAPSAVQAKLLRAIQFKEIVRVGGTDTIPVDVRLLAATNKDLEHEVAEGRFREDLYYRLSVFPIHLPPLRERIEDIPLLAEHFLEQGGAAGKSLGFEATESLSRYDWPGNVRQLENVIARAAVLSDASPTLDPEHFDPKVIGEATKSVAAEAGVAVDVRLLDLPLRAARERFERFYVENLLRQCQGNVSEASRRAGIGRASLHDKINRLGLKPDDYRVAPGG